ncbi:lysylphosphatidylglycerol synthase transmembrane domain-containing protein [Nibrella saemangeumensis]|uniref:Lysylphosphatidylglycerol synthase transmembrane domain-containing protein n=1 Tax=Nibrella saemangeumensis TaxID=1084526 RepID=A0ABP8MU84_9BACT
MKRLIRRVLPALLAVVLLAYALKDISFADIAGQFRQANYGWIAAVGLITALSFYVRGMRWRQALLGLGYQPTAFRATVAYLAGIIASMIVPGSGELTRCATLQRTDRVPFSQGVGSVVAERIVDLLMLGLLLLLTFLLELRRMRAYFSDLSMAAPGTLGWWLVGVALVGGLLGLWLMRRALRTHTLRQHPFVQKLIRAIQGLWKGFMSIRQLPHPWLFVFLTALIQGLVWLSTYWLLLSLDSTQSLPPSAALTILTVSSIGGILIPTQGGIGTFHFLVSRALVLYGFTAANGAVVATFLHAVSFGLSLLLSSLSFLLVPFLLTRRPEQS